MPGIAGIIGKQDTNEGKRELRTMVDGIIHEPHYSSGFYVNEVMQVYIGWAAHNGSFCDCMPVWNESRDICLIYSGEDFADSGVVADLRAKGHQFDGKDATRLVHLYEELGQGFLERLNGWFSGLLIDIRTGTLMLFNDRYGLGRIYYAEDEAGFYFASEAKALLKVLPRLRKVDYKSLGEVFACGCVLQNRTIFSGISLLPQGSKWFFSGGPEALKKSYFDPASWECLPTLGEEEYYEHLRDTFRGIVPRYFQGNDGIGMSLTGGLDGRMIMASAKRAPGTLPCYSFGSTYRDNVDVKIARQVAGECGQTHRTIIVGPEFYPRFPQLAERAVYISDGTMDVTGSVELYVNAVAREIASVRLTGNYGSEIIRGGVAFRPGTFPVRLLDDDFLEHVRTAAFTYEQEYRCHPLTFIAFKQVPWHHYSRLSVEQSQLVLRSPYLDNDLVALVYQAPPGAVINKKPSLRIIENGNKSLAKIPTDRGLLYRPIPLVTDICHRYAEFMFKAEYAYDYGMPQWVARIDHAVKMFHLERIFLGRHKFYHFRVWYRDYFFRYLEDVLLDHRSRSRDYLKGKELERIVTEHVKGHANHTVEIHRMLTTELIYRLFIEA